LNEKIIELEKEIGEVNEKIKNSNGNKTNESNVLEEEKTNLMARLEKARNDLTETKQRTHTIDAERKQLQHEKSQLEEAATELKIIEETLRKKIVELERKNNRLKTEKNELQNGHPQSHNNTQTLVTQLNAKNQEWEEMSKK